MAKPASKRADIIRQIRKIIVRGDLKPGEQLPTYLVLQKRFSTTSSTIRLAVEELCREGFIVSRAPQGLFVSQTPPHLSRFGVLLPEWYGGVTFTSVIDDAVKEYADEDHELVAYEAVDSTSEPWRMERLQADIRSHLLAGLIVGSFPSFRVEEEVLKQCDLPRVAICLPREGIHTIYPDEMSFYRRAFELVRGRGRRRVAMVTTFKTEWPEPALELLSQMEMTTRPEWFQASGPQAVGCIRNAVHLLFSENQRERPDALVVADDNLAQYAAAGLLASGVQAPRDVEVVMHCNYPRVPMTVVPATLLGYDVREILRQCVRTLDALRAGHDVPSHQAVSARLESEMVAAERQMDATLTARMRRERIG